MTPSGSPIPLAAGVVVCGPDPRLLEDLVRSLVTQVDVLFLYANDPLPECLLGLVRQHSDRVSVLGDGRNLGLGAAYNRIIAAAMSRGIDHILLFDQDSEPPDFLGQQLLHRMRLLIDAGSRPAVIGPRPVMTDGKFYKLPPRAKPMEANQAASSISLQFLISSGSLINGSAFCDTGPFREDFFIDAVDVEWCLRARSKGYTCWLATDVHMPHRLGAGVVRVPLVGVRVVRQTPLRAYTFIRNQLALMRFGNVPAGWKARAAARIVLHTITQLLYAQHLSVTVRSLARGWRDGILGRLGPPRPT